ncbi:MAG: HAD family hydrolase [Syntrophaceae bacterium]|nr:HAD family hydrolase [Syntrophaceae bacterium]
MNTDILKSYLNRIPDKKKVLSFDVFDTLLLRMIPPERMAGMAAEEMSRRFHQETNLTFTASEILDSRLKFKQKMDRAYYYREAEWTLTDWLNDFADKHSVEPSMLCRIGRASELAAESSCLLMIPGALDLLSIAKDKGLIVIALSDIWLDQDWLEELIKIFGLSFDNVFSSGAMGVSKRKGTIFQKVQNILGIKDEAFLHIGDNLKADFIRPRLSGWTSIWVPRPGHRLTIRKLPFTLGHHSSGKSWKDILQALECESLKITTDPYSRLGYNHLAPLLIIFSILQWRQFRKQDIDIIFYIARDAKAMFDVYNIIVHLLPDSCPRRYIRLSRQAVAVAHPDNFLQNVIPLPGKVGRKKVSEWIGNFTISSDLRREILLFAKVNDSDDFNESTQQLIRHACRQLLPKIIEEQNDQKQIIKDYLSQEAGNALLRRVGIVDSGWACTIQDSIRSTLIESDIVSGIYLGVSKQGCKPGNRNTKLGILRDDFRQCPHHNPLESTAGVVRMWDTILREPCGTASNLHRRSDGRIEATLRDGVILGDIEHRAAQAIQQGIHEGTSARLKGVSLLVKLSEQFTDTDFEIAATMISKRISSHPQKDIARAIIQLGFDEGSAGGGKGSLGGFDGLKKGVAWYPGILATMKMGWMSHFLKMIAKVVLKKRLN